MLVRGRFWKNTAEAQQGIPPVQQAAPVSSVEDLIKRLAPTNRTEDRKAAAVALAGLGAAARGAIPALLQAVVDVNATVRQAAISALHAIDPAWSQYEGVQQAIPFLIGVLKSRSASVVDAATQLLLRVGPSAISELQQALSAVGDVVEKVFIPSATFSARDVKPLVSPVNTKATSSGNYREPSMAFA
jgi:hypothetical protein